MHKAMNEERFWTIIQRSLDKGADHSDRQAENLTTELQPLSSEEIESFGHIHEQLRQRAFTWDLWGAAYIIGGGCSDDEFWWFLGWLVSRGRNWFERALADPNDLADYPERLVAASLVMDLANHASEVHLKKFGYFPNVELVGGISETTGER